MIEHCAFRQFFQDLFAECGLLYEQNTFVIIHVYTRTLFEPKERALVQAKSI